MHNRKTMKILMALTMLIIFIFNSAPGLATEVIDAAYTEKKLPSHMNLYSAEYDINYTAPDIENDWDYTKGDDYQNSENEEETTEDEYTSDKDYETDTSDKQEYPEYSGYPEYPESPDYEDKEVKEPESEEQAEEDYPENEIPSYTLTRPLGLSMDVSAYLNTSSFQLLLHPWWWGEGQPVPPPSSGHVSPWNDIFAFRFTLESNLQGGTLQSGDTARFRIPHLPEGQTGFINAQDSDWQDFYDDYYAWNYGYSPDYPPVVLGRWRIYSGHVEIEFTENAEGLAQIKAGFMTGPVLYTSIQTGGVRHISFGGLTHSVNFEARNWSRLPFSPWLTTEGVSPTHVDWRLDLNRVGLWELAGATFPGDGAYIFGDYPPPIIERNNFVVEVQLEGTFVSADFHTRIARPLEVINPQDGFFNMPSSRTQPVDFSSHMTRIHRNDNEDYEDFKARVMSAPFQWGLWYEYAGGYQTLIAYFGNLGRDGPRIIDVNPNFIDWVTNSAMVSEGWPEHHRNTVRNWFEALYGPGNAIGGRIIYPSIRIVEEHPPNSYGRDVQIHVNNRYMYSGVCWCSFWDDECWCYECTCEDPNESGFSRWHWAHLPASNAWATGVPGNQARLYLYNQDTAERLAGVTFQLQSFVNGNWVNLRRFTTNASGYFNAHVGIGEFRFVQLDVADDNIYTLSNSSHDSYSPLLGAPYSGQILMSEQSTSGVVSRVFNTQNPFLTITVKDENRNAIPGATVVIRNPEGTMVGTIKTDSDGSVSLQVPPNTIYQISVSHPSFAASSSMAVSMGEADKDTYIVLSAMSDNGGGNGSGNGNVGSDPGGGVSPPNNNGNEGVIIRRPSSGRPGMQSTTTIPSESSPEIQRPESLPELNAPSLKQNVELFRRHYISGYPDGTIQTDGSITRAEMMQMFFNISSEQSPTVTSSRFLDVHPNDWFFNAVVFLESKGIVQGFADGTLRPNAPISNAEFAAMSVKFFNLNNLIEPDVLLEKESHWGANYINLGFASGWFEYFGIAETFNPDAALPRGQAVTLLNFYQGRKPSTTAIDAFLSSTNRTVFPDLNRSHWSFYEIMEAAFTRFYYLDFNGKEVWSRVLN